jgi:hypothetical protein
MAEEKTTSEELKLMAKALKEMQLMLEPIRDKVLDEKARLTGYAQCAEQMISIIVAKMVDYEKKSESINIVEPENKTEELVEKTDKSERKKKVAKQETT